MMIVSVLLVCNTKKYGELALYPNVYSSNSSFLRPPFFFNWTKSQGPLTSSQRPTETAYAQGPEFSATPLGPPV